MEKLVHAAAEHMALHAEPQADGTGIFTGTPRGVMEFHGVSSGPAYRSLYEQGFRRRGRGRNARWSVPSDWMERARKVRVGTG